MEENSSYNLSNYSPILISSLSIFLFFYLLRRRSSSSDESPKKSHAPTPCTYPIVGNAVGFVRNRHRFYDWATELLASTPTNTIEIRGLAFTQRGVCTARPDNVAHLLRTNFGNYVKGSRFSDRLAELLGVGIFNVDGELWSAQRKIASHEFNTRSLRAFVADTVRSQISLRLLPMLSAAAQASATVDLQDILQRFSFDNICNLAFGNDPGCLNADLDWPGLTCASPAHSFLAAFDDAVEISCGRFFSLSPWFWKMKRLLNLGSERTLKMLIKTINDYVESIIETKLENRSKSLGVNFDLLSRFIHASVIQDPKEEKKFLRDTVLSFVLAGKDSTSAALTWFFWLLSENKRCERRIYAEIEEAVARSEAGVLNFEELKEMSYLHASIMESLRLYPPVALDSRVAVAEDVLPDGTYVGAGWFADYSAYAMGRMESVWGKDCKEYVPERWMEGGLLRLAGDDQWRFPVFHGGPRLCLGREMAYLQMKAVAAVVIYEFEMEMVRKERPHYLVSLTTKMRGGLPVRLRRRNK